MGQRWNTNGSTEATRLHKVSTVMSLSTLRVCCSVVISQLARWRLLPTAQVMKAAGTWVRGRVRVRVRVKVRVRVRFRVRVRVKVRVS